MASAAIVPTVLTAMGMVAAAGAIAGREDLVTKLDLERDVNRMHNRWQLERGIGGRTIQFVGLACVLGLLAASTGW